MELKRKTSLLLLGVLVIFLFLIVFGARPLLGDIRAYSEELYSLRKSFVLLEQKSVKTPELKQKLEALRPDLENIQNLLVDLETPIEFLQFLEKTAKDSNLGIDVTLISEKKEKVSSFPSLCFRLTLPGPFSDCLRFLEKLENAPYLIEIGDFTIRRLGEKELGSEQYLNLLLGDVVTNLSIRVLAE